MNETTTFRRVAVALTIGSFSIAALMGIVALLSGGDFGEGQVKVLLTTLIVGCASICVLCYLATAGSPWAAVGGVGALVLVLPVVTSLVLVWHDWDDYNFPDEGWGKWFGVGAVLAATLAQICLLLALAGQRSGLRFVLWSTIALASVLAVVISVIIINEVETENGWRFIGTIAILDVLGTLVTIALAKFGRGPARFEDDPLLLPPALDAQLAERAAAEGRSRASVLAEAVEQFLRDA